jgi:hypothetical protein
MPLVDTGSASGNAALDIATKAADQASKGKIQKTIDKGEAVGANVLAGMALGSCLGPWGTIAGGIAGGIYGFFDQFGGDLVEFFSGPPQEGVDWCLDFFRQKTSCDNIDRRMNNVVRMQRDLRAVAPDSLTMTIGEAASKWDVEDAYASAILALEAARWLKLDVNMRGADHMMHANPQWFAGLKTEFGAKLGTVESIRKQFGVTSDFAARLLSDAQKLSKPKPVPPPRKVTLSASMLHSVVSAMQTNTNPTPAAPAADLHAVVEAAHQGDATAKAAVGDVAQRAQAGDPTAIGTAKALQEANDFRIAAAIVKAWTGRDLTVW